MPRDRPCTVADVKRALRAHADPRRAAAVAKFFRTGPGEYGEGDRFLGVTVPQQRQVARACRALPLSGAVTLLRSPWHEDRLTALLLMVDRFQRGGAAERTEVVRAWLANLHHVNNWDLVDSSAPYLLGPWLRDRPRGLLRQLARSKVLWERRVAMVSTLPLIRDGESADAFALARALEGDPHDLLHKAVGWMLREVGKHVGVDALRGFLSARAATMDRTALRYAIERLPAAERARWLAARDQVPEARTRRRGSAPKPRRRRRSG